MIPLCPKCSKRLVRKGFSRAGQQDFQCKNGNCDVKRTVFPVWTIKENQVEIEGLKPDSEPVDSENIREKLLREQEQAEARIAKRYSQTICIDDHKPVFLALVSDVHLGGKYVDYKTFFRDEEIIAETDGMYCIETGDMHDNWVGKLEGIQREQIMSFDSEIGLLKEHYEKISDSLLAVCSGNHENRTKKLVHIDHIKEFLKNTNLLYDSDEILFTLSLGEGADWRFKVRHRWKGHSTYNDTHAIEKDQKFTKGESSWDVGIGGHTHIGTMIRPFIQNDQYCMACLVGTYKMWDKYPIQCGGYGVSIGPGCGGLMLFPDGKILPMYDLVSAQNYLQYLRG